MKKSVVVYWLIPARPERELFRELIRILAKQFQAPRFEPHVTLCFGLATGGPSHGGQDRQSPQKILRQVNAAPVRLHVGEVGYSSKFTKTLFVRLKPNRALNKLAAALGDTGLQDPHVSLLYKRLPARTKKELAATIKLPFRSVTFDAIKAVRCTSPTTTAAEVKRWRVIATRRLSE
jgi:hypothetical protein